MALRLVPCNITNARKWIQKVHSHLDAPLTGLFAVAVEDDGRLCCIGFAEIPKSRKLMQAGCCELSRIASDGTQHAASMTIAALARAAIALGYRRIISYTILGERGTSYRAAGFWPVSITEKESGIGWANRSGRINPQQPFAKVRWEYGPDAMPRDQSIMDAVNLAICENPGQKKTSAYLPLLAILDEGAL